MENTKWEGLRGDVHMLGPGIAWDGGCDVLPQRDSVIDPPSI